MDEVYVASIRHGRPDLVRQQSSPGTGEGRRDSRHHRGQDLGECFTDGEAMNMSG